jgi:hypothetical protein
MTSKIKPVFVYERSGSLDVFSFHCHFAEIVQQSSRAKRSPIMSGQMENLCDFVGNCGDAQSVLVHIALESIRFVCKSQEGLAGVLAKQICRLNS